jgi:hypothetical protein
MPKQSQTQLAYLDGIIDGEGHVLIRSRKADNGWKLGLIICMADVQILEWCHEHFGGTLSGNWRPKEGNSRPRKIWSLHRSRGLEKVATGLLPHLVLKRAEVQIMLRAIEHAKVKPGPRLGRAAWYDKPEAVRAIQLRAWEQGQQAIFRDARAAMLARK